MFSVNFKKMIRSAISVFTAAAIIAVAMPTAFAAVKSDVIGNYDFSISNPYEEVNWDTWKGYRGATHVHTVRSDGNVELDDMIENYYALGYQCLALTDHGTVNYSWTENQKRLAIFGYQFAVHGNVDELTQARYEQITNGMDRNGDGMIEIPLGIELNGSSTAKCHVNSYFADCGHGDLEISSKWPETAVQKCEKAGGVCHINHVGEWTEGRNDINTYDEAFISDFSKLFLNYSSCIGMELVNTRDNRTHNDRYLYDQTLMVTAPQGVPIWGFCEDDAHDPEDCANNAQFFMMPMNTWQNVRTSMETGAFFACSKTSKNECELGDGFTAQGDFPMISRIDVDEEKNQITICPYNSSVIKMVADGNIIDERSVSEVNDSVTFDLNEYEDSINSYVRFYVTGPGGICYIQPFLVTKTPMQKSVIKFELNPFDATITVRNSNGDIIEPANSDGEYIMPIDSYTVSVSKDGYEAMTQNLTVYDNTTRQTLSLSLDRILIYPIDNNTLSIDYNERYIIGMPEPTTAKLDSFIGCNSGVLLKYQPGKLGLGTGTKITASDDLGNNKVYNLIIKGDTDGNGIYNGMDAVIARAIYDGMVYGSRIYTVAADVNDSGSVDAWDVEWLVQSGIFCV